MMKRIHGTYRWVDDPVVEATEDNSGEEGHWIAEGGVGQVQ